MKPVDLMVGDYIMFNKNTYIIEEISKKGWAHLIGNDGSECHVELSSDYILDAITPIPLTAEILEENWFKKELSEDNIHYRFILIYDGVRFSLLYARSVFQWLGPLDFKFVHELQHALRLCGINKEITI